jgi:hypothetical protein
MIYYYYYYYRIDRWLDIDTWIHTHTDLQMDSARTHAHIYSQTDKHTLF